MQTDDGPFLDNLEENTCFGSSDKFKQFLNWQFPGSVQNC